MFMFVFMCVEMHLSRKDCSFLVCRGIIKVNLSLRIAKRVKVQNSIAQSPVQRLHGGVGGGGQWPSALYGGMKCFHAVSLCLWQRSKTTPAGTIRT